ncbi:uncharacterized protein N7482_006935 [Penicillium canariense]|uniref:Uncharacterized protein n=1 Tax=Penicillium canariense TaxID=189055 RepID=A0A9W9LK39_9EURO|nr:uncharacterized protein N7482_006935 [Penicillium canariense]KAJ5159931.1 hypothetical protein N7482_006935 [Penicillium canariense]
MSMKEAAEIFKQFQSDKWLYNGQVLWSGVSRSQAQEWADRHHMQTLTTAMGSLMDELHPDCLKSSKTPHQWGQGDKVTLLSPPPPERFHPSGLSNYQAIEQPIVQGLIGEYAVQKIMMVHPTVKESEEFSYEAATVKFASIVVLALLIFFVLTQYITLLLIGLLFALLERSQSGNEGGRYRQSQCNHNDGKDSWDEINGNGVAELGVTPSRTTKAEPHAQTKAEDKARKKAKADEKSHALAEEKARKKVRALKQDEARKKAKAEKESRARAEEKARKKAKAEKKARALKEEEAKKKAKAEKKARALKEEEARKKAKAEKKARALKEAEARKKAKAEEKSKAQHR